MDESPLYEQIAEAVRQEILRGGVQPGEKLPSVRRMAEVWKCTPGTVQRAYAELTSQGLVEGRPGQGTRVKGLPPEGEAVALRRATLLHRVEGFLLETMSTGYQLNEVEEALRMALDRWRSVALAPEAASEDVLRFAGSHDPVVTLLAERFPDLAAGMILRVRFVGSLGGLIKLAQGEVDIAGCHLWDQESDTYNTPFVRRLLPGRRVALLTLAHRRLGLIVPPGNPAGLAEVKDLTRPGLRFVSRQRGAGTRIWLEAQLQRQGIHLKQITRYKEEALTHSDVARLIAAGEADVGVGVEAAAVGLGLDFVPLTQERYDLVIPNFVWKRPPVQAFVAWLRSGAAKELIMGLSGYDTCETGKVSWIE